MSFSLLINFIKLCFSFVKLVLECTVRKYCNVVESKVYDTKCWDIFNPEKNRVYTLSKKVYTDFFHIC